MVDAHLQIAQLGAVITANIASSSLFIRGEDMLLLTLQLFIQSFHNI